ncbi:MAG: ATP-dependent helicase [Propioniciclava sp.]
MVNRVAEADGPMLVLGAAGTGKTTMLVEAVASRMGRGQPPLVLTLTRQAASDLRDRVVRSLRTTTVAPQIMTVHALCLSLITRFAETDDHEPALLSAPEQEFRIRTLVGGSGAGWPEDLVPALGTQGFAQQVRGVLARARHLGLDPEAVTGFGADSAEPGWVALGRFMAEYLDVLDIEQALDYAELVHRARLLLEQPRVAERVRADIGALYIDEWCELDAAQIALVRALAPPDGPVVALADPDTAIYRFRGAHPRAVAVFDEQFTRAGERPTVVVLDRAPRRSAAEVAATARLARRLGLPAVDQGAAIGYRSVEADGGAGRVEVCTFPDAATQARHIAAEVRQAHLRDGIAWGAIAVLVREARSQLPPLARALTDAGIPVEVAGDEIGLAAELAVRPLLLGLEVAGAGGRPDPDQAVRLLSSRWGGCDAVHLRQLGRRLREADADAVGRPVETLLAEVLAGERPVPEGEDALAERCALLRRCARRVEAGNRSEHVLWELWSGTPWPEQLRQDALAGGDNAPGAHHDLDAVCALFELAATSRGPGGRRGIDWFLAEVAQQQIPADSQRESAIAGRGVRLLTAHRAKGRHWSFVVVAGVQEGLWPDVRRGGSLFDPQRLSSAGLGGGVDLRDLVASERRLFLLACTRAERRLLVTAVEGTEGEDDRPSRFLTELGVPVRHLLSTPERLNTLRDLVVDLRRTAQDPVASPSLRVAAAHRLAELADATDHDGRALVPDADPERWWGLRSLTSTGDPAAPAVVRLSPSQIESLLTCPRQYYLRREVRAEAPRDTRTLLGSVIHAVVERAAVGDLRPEEVTDALNDVWDDLPFSAAWLSASERAEADAAIERFLAWQQGHEHADLVGVELRFSASVQAGRHQVELVGVVDRLERLPDGTLRIVDFKTGRSRPTKEAARSHPQMGVYQLAVEAGGFAGSAGGADTSAGASLVFLRHDAGHGWPQEFRQPSLTEAPHLSDDPAEHAHPTWVHERVARACDVLVEGRYDARPGAHCTWCPVRSSCPARSGQVVS